MIKVTFVNSHGEERTIATVENEDEVIKAIDTFLLAYPHFKRYYTRINFYPEYNEYDVGSHTEFFRAYKTEEKERISE